MDDRFALLAEQVLMTRQAGAGLLNAALGLGTVLGGAASVALVGRRRMAPALGLAAVTWGAAITLIGLGSPASLALALVALGGIGFAATDVVGRTILQRVTADRMLARVLGGTRRRRADRARRRVGARAAAGRMAGRRGRR